MLRMEAFEFVAASSYAEALALWAPDAMYVAGGTDLMPNLKHRLFSPKRVIGLGGISGGVREEAGSICIGAATTLDVMATDSVLLGAITPLAKAAGLVAGPQIRAMGTLGGNILLDTRCLYYNQSESWRKSLGYCLKKEGTWCHVVGGPKTCVASQSSDTVPVLLGLDASIRLLGPAGEREMRLRDLFRFNGMDHLAILPGELLTEVVIPKPSAGFRGSYEKVRTRDSIDFPQVGVSVTGTWDGNIAKALDIVIGAVNPQPKPVRGLEAHLGRAMDGENIAAIADLVYKQTRPQASAHGDTAWRRQMAAVLVRRALAKLGTEC